MVTDWIAQKDSIQGTLKNLEICYKQVLVMLKLGGTEFKPLPMVYLGTLKELYQYRGQGFVPTIAERMDDIILFYHEIIKEVIEKINNEEEISQFISSVCLHELVHILRKHRANTAWHRLFAEIDARKWMKKNAPEFQKIFDKHMPSVQIISEKLKKE